MIFEKAAVPTGRAFPDRALARFAEAIVQRIAGTAHRADRINAVTTIERFAQTADVHVDSTFIDINVAAHTPSSNCSRENTLPGRSIRNSSRRNSVGPRSTGRLERDTRFFSRSSSRSPIISTVATRSGLARRNRARIRASNSGTENGLTR